jgi:hypothetical protein
MDIIVREAKERLLRAKQLPDLHAMPSIIAWFLIHLTV